jgi:hypothetical protein
MTVAQTSGLAQASTIVTSDSKGFEATAQTLLAELRRPSQPTDRLEQEVG